MKIVEIFKANILSPASKTFDNNRYLMIDGRQVMADENLENLVETVLKQSMESPTASNLDVQFPNRRGFFWDRKNNICYGYQSISQDETIQVGSKLAEYRRP